MTILKLDFKYIHIGLLIKQRVVESKMDLSRICNFIDATESDINLMYDSESLDLALVLKWSKLLEYDFFRIYSQHLILYAPSSKVHSNHSDSTINNGLPIFRKNIYTREIIDFIVDQVETNEKTKSQIIKEYRIPKTTLYKWLTKYRK